MKKIGLVLEGGGFRGIFAEGFTAWLIEHAIEIPYVIGVSMGAINGVNYVSKQKGRNLRIVEEFIHDSRYISTRNLVTQGSLFGMDFIFDDIAHKHVVFDFETFNTSRQELVIGAMNCETGETTYKRKSTVSTEDMMQALRASISLPFISKLTYLDDVPHLDGGLTDPIPARKALEDGCDKIIVVTTRDLNYVKEPFKGAPVGKMFYRHYPEVTKALKNRHLVYRETQGYLKGLEASGTALVIRPKSPLKVGRTEKNLDKVREAFQLGYQTAQRYEKEIIRMLD